jgi:hypothetical protein
MLSMWLTWPARLNMTSQSRTTRSIAHQVVHRARLADIGDVDANAILDPGDVEQVPAVPVDQRVDQKDVGAERREAMCEVAADEPEPAGHHHAATAIELQV